MRALLSTAQLKAAVAVDFETKGIGPRPHEYPPRPVGVSIVGPGVKEYLAWGHQGGNTTTVAQAKRRVGDVFRSGAPVVFHNEAFDLEVALRWLGLKAPEDHHDTLLLAFLDDPRQGTLSLKPLATKMLGRPPTEQDAVRNWILDHVKGVKAGNWGAHICDAPAALVGRYAIGDADRTLRLFQLLYRRVVTERSMGAAYLRERRVGQVLTGMQERGVRIDVRRLEKDALEWLLRAQKIEKNLIRRFGGARALMKKLDVDVLNLGSPQQLADMLEEGGYVEQFELTTKGNRSTKRESLYRVSSNKGVVDQLAKRALLLKYLSTYATKWLETSVDGLVYPRVNQVYGYHDESRGGGGGARTGRLSYSDSWQAIPAPNRRPFPDLPNLRDYVVPSAKGRRFNVRDYSQQEFRILAHYEDGPLLAKYQGDPTIDMHDAATALIKEITGMTFDRRPVKDTGFGLLYGMGVKKLARKAKIDEPTAKILKGAYLKAVPGLPRLQREIEQRCRAGEAIRTWGGREYFVEPPKVKDGELRTFEYKMLNVLIQGSAADCTKEAMIRAEEALQGTGATLTLQIHDELVSDAPAGKAGDRAMARLREAMESVTFDVKMLSDGKIGKTWGTTTKMKEKRA